MKGNISLTKKEIILTVISGFGFVIGLAFIAAMFPPETTQPMAQKPLDQPVELTREEKIKAQFNAWDGTHINLKKAIQDKMNDPESFKVIETRFLDEKGVITVQTEFTGKNGFGGTVRQTVRAEVDLDGNILKMWEVK